MTYVKKRPDEFESMSVQERREFLKWMGVFLGSAVAAPWATDALKFACREMLLGEAYAATVPTGPINFIEINLRRQFDFTHMMVAPGIAQDTNLLRASRGDYASLHYRADQLTQAGGTSYLTPDSIVLRPHADSIALFEGLERCAGKTHGHEAANAARSPGRSGNPAAGRPMYDLESVGDFMGNEYFFGTVPTPAVLHNYAQRSADPNVRRGLTMKAMVQHTTYHFEADLPASVAQLDRYRSTADLINAMSSVTLPPDEPPVHKKHSALMASLLKRLDGDFLNRVRYYGDLQRADHPKNFDGVANTLRPDLTPKPFNLALSAEERAYWSSGVNLAASSFMPISIWEQFAYATKLINNGIVRTVAMEIDSHDEHGPRDMGLMSAWANSISLPLARMIEQLKAAGIYDRTLIAIYSLDGSRGQALDSDGDYGRNSVMLAGGMVKGGYYGDLHQRRVGQQVSYRLRLPDPNTGAPTAGEYDEHGPMGSSEGRYPGGSIWKAIARYSGVPGSLISRYAGTATGPELHCMFR